LSNADPSQPLSRLDRLWLAEAVRLTEEHAGLLDDAEANRRARARGGDLRQRILTRADWLARQNGLRPALLQWRQSAGLMLVGLALLALLTGSGLVFAAVGDGSRPVNVFWALGVLLGLHLLTLLGWAASFAVAGRGGALGDLWLWLSSRIARSARTAQLMPALLTLLGRQRLARWGLSLLVHGLWLLILASALLTLIALFAARRYDFVWETTLLGADGFVALTRWLGALPSLAGFPVPEPELVRASANTAPEQEAARRAWASWLLGALLVYGLLPRLVLALLCLWRWRRGLRHLDLDLDVPEYALLRERLLPATEHLGVRDAAPHSLPNPQGRGHSEHGSGALLVAIELDDRHPWPPPLPEGVADGGRLDTRQQRQRLLEQLTEHPPARLAIACDPHRTVDRGTLNLIAELARLAAATRVWLVAPPADEAVDHVRREEWRAAIGGLQIEVVDSAPLGWLETGA
jgi:hypothetical protein